MKRINKLSLGIIGLGRIGTSISLKFSAFSKNISFMIHMSQMVMKRFMVFIGIKFYQIFLENLT